MNNPVKVIGHIMLPDAPIKHKCICEECGDILNTKFGDPRIEVLTYPSKYDKQPTSSRLICPVCANDLFGDSEPCSIFS